MYTTYQSMSEDSEPCLELSVVYFQRKNHIHPILPYCYCHIIRHDVSDVQYVSIVWPALTTHPT